MGDAGAKATSGRRGLGCSRRRGLGRVSLRTCLRPRGSHTRGLPRALRTTRGLLAAASQRPAG